MARDLAIAALAGLLFLGLSHLATHNVEGFSSGFPLAYGSLNPATCGAINSFNGCGYSYNIFIVALDYLFWVAAAFAVVFPIDLARGRFT